MLSWVVIQTSLWLIKQWQHLANTRDDELGLGQKSQFPALFLGYWSDDEFVCDNSWCSWNQWEKGRKWCRLKILLFVFSIIIFINVSGVNWQCKDVFIGHHPASQLDTLMREKILSSLQIESLTFIFPLEIKVRELKQEPHFLFW